MAADLFTARMSVADASPASGAGPVPYLTAPRARLDTPAGPIASFVRDDDANLDRRTVEAFGDEWQRFSEFSDGEVRAGGQEYFGDLVDERTWTGARVLDVGCGSGRWTRFAADRAAFVEGVDPSDAARVAAMATRGRANVRITHASVESLPFADRAFDVVMSVGVLHHVPDTEAAIARVARCVRPGGLLYLYLYYKLDGRPLPYRAAFHASNALRAVISRLPDGPKNAASEIAAVAIYWPFVTLARVLRRAAPGRRWFERVPLHYYADKPWKIVRNDARDRLGTPLERRFSRDEITAMLARAGLVDIRFADAMPRWRVVASAPAVR
jgi:SAM-dependent methyltransferase